MKFRQWMNESRELSKRRMDVLIERFSVQELIEYRDIYHRQSILVRNMVLVLVFVCLFAMFLMIVLSELSIIEREEHNISFGYLFGFTIAFTICGCPSGSYERRLTKAIEERCLRELELRK